MPNFEVSLVFGTALEWSPWLEQTAELSLLSESTIYI